MDTSQFLNQDMGELLGIEETTPSYNTPNSDTEHYSSAPSTPQFQQSYLKQPPASPSMGFTVTGMPPLSPFPQVNSFGSAPPLFYQQSSQLLPPEPQKIPTTLVRLHTGALLTSS